MSIRTCFSFEGRITRKTFWLTWLAALGLVGLSLLVAGLLTPTGRAGAIVAAVLSCLGILIAAWVSLATQVKRWHDLDRSGWMIFISFLPVVGFIICVVCLGFVRGTRTPNRFDRPPGFVPDPVTTPADKVEIPRQLPPLITTPPKLVPLRQRRALLIVASSLLLTAVAGVIIWIIPGTDWETRRSWFRATLGSPEEAQAMGQRYRAGRGVPQDFGEATSWFERAASKGLARAQYDLGVLKYYGIGTPVDSGEARRWLEKAVQQDYVPAMTLLGLLCADEDPSSAQARSLWEKAADAGDPWAESLLGSACLARRAEGDGNENLILGLYWMESARRHGVEPVGGLLQHAWATVGAEDLEAVTGEVFARLENGRPDPLPRETPAPVVAALPAPEGPVTAVAPTDSVATPVATTEETGAPTEDTITTGKLNDELLASVRASAQYTTISTLYAEKSQADPNWSVSKEGQAVGQYLQTMRSDAAAAQIKKAEDGTLSLEYSVGGNLLSDEGVRAADLESDEAYRRSVVEALAKNILAAPQPLLVSEFLKNSDSTGGVSK